MGCVPRYIDCLWPMARNPSHETTDGVYFMLGDNPMAFPMGSYGVEHYTHRHVPMGCPMDRNVTHGPSRGLPAHAKSTYMASRGMVCVPWDAGYNPMVFPMDGLSHTVIPIVTPMGCPMDRNVTTRPSSGNFSWDATHPMGYPMG